ncbi:putative squalene/phytoene synthase [Taylorella equigenitalis 14/56]|uniref:Putative squalene/phytoene synthase n=1 Tax=Taylorella equigenitalis 14/56 TaxID=1091497 RepID=I7IB74_9BURK|nr:squalene/phytoene synthase family protein [Taylorella equigenitalis]ASY30438.1 phytoene synthase [Taylorella equigenitalis]KOS58452.1 phytoene synthase [Taylorella equigenitalis]CCG18300.1 putative squalene/phytoene synthase [Taylorella equigenitalis 14/56]
MAKNPSLTPSEQVINEKTYSTSSPEHFAYLYLADDKKNSVRTLYALFNEIKNILYTQSDSNIARIKLSWWKDAIEKLYLEKSNSVNHPLLFAFNSIKNKHNINLQFLLNVIESVEMDLTHNRYLEFRSLNKFHALQSGSIFSAVSQILGSTKPDVIKHAQNLGEFLHFVDMISEMGIDASQGRIYVPMEYLRKHEITASDFLKATPKVINSPLKDFLILEASAKSNEVLKLYEALPPEEKKNLRPLKALRLMGEAKLKKIKKGDPFKNEIALTPLHMLMISSRVWL